MYTKLLIISDRIFWWPEGQRYGAEELNKTTYSLVLAKLILQNTFQGIFRHTAAQDRIRLKHMINTHAGY